MTMNNFWSGIEFHGDDRGGHILFDGRKWYPDSDLPPIQDDSITGEPLGFDGEPNPQTYDNCGKSDLPSTATLCIYCKGPLGYAEKGPTP